MSNSIYQDLLTGYRDTLLPRASAKKQLNESISITVSDEDAEALLQLLAMAGINPKSDDEEVAFLDEPLEEERPEFQSADWPTNTETMQDTPTLSAYSGGLNKPKVTKQTTGSPVNVSPRRGSFNENAELERTLFNLYQEVKGEKL